MIFRKLRLTNLIAISYIYIHDLFRKISIKSHSIREESERTWIFELLVWIREESEITWIFGLLVWIREESERTWIFALFVLVREER